MSRACPKMRQVHVTFADSSSTLLWLDRAKSACRGSGAGGIGRSLTTPLSAAQFDGGGQRPGLGLVWGQEERLVVWVAGRWGWCLGLGLGSRVVVGGRRRRGGGAGLRWPTGRVKTNGVMFGREVSRLGWSSE